MTIFLFILEPCKDDEFGCVDGAGVCIDENGVCDGHQDCIDAEDELDCRKCKTTPQSKI